MREFRKATKVRWDLVCVSVMSALMGAALSQHYFLATSEPASVQRQAPRIVTRGVVGKQRVLSNIVEGLPSLLDPSGRSGLNGSPRSTTSVRKIIGFESWSKVKVASNPAKRNAPLEFCESSAARLEDLVFVIGGFLCDFNRVTDVVQVLNRTSGLWSTVATLPPTAARTHQGVAAVRSKTQPETIWLFLVSGQIGPGCTAGTAESWGLALRGRKQHWLRMADLPEIRYAPSAYVAKGFLHVVGGAGPNRLDPKSDHWVLPLSISGKPVNHAGWFKIDFLPDGGADSAGFVMTNNFAYRFGGQHGHPRAVSTLTDNNV